MFYDMKKIGIVIFGLLVLIAIAIAFTTVVVANPPIPESYWGNATLDGAPAATGMPITVEVYGTGEEVGNTTVIDANGNYTLSVIFDDPDTSEDEGADDGDSLTWKINGIVCSIPAPGTDKAELGGTNDNFNITASHPPPAPPPVAVPEYNEIGLLALIGILTIILAFATLRRK